MMPPGCPTRLAFGAYKGAPTTMVCKNRLRPSGLLLTALLTAWCFAGLAAAAETAAPTSLRRRAEIAARGQCARQGAKGDGRTDDTVSIQAAIDEVGGTGGTVLVPNGTYMVEVVDRQRRVTLKSDMTLKLANDAVLKAFPNNSRKYAVLSIADVSNVTVVGGTLEGDRSEHKGKDGEAGMGIRISHGAKRITVSGVTARKMWGDGFYVEGAKDTKFCDVIADNNRRQGLSIIEASGVLVTNSMFKNTHGTRPSAGIDLEPDEASQKIVNVRIQNSKFIDNAGPGIQIAGKRGAVAKVELARNMFRGNRPILVENAGGACFCDLRQSSGHVADGAAQGPYAFADTVDVVVHQNDCEEGRDMRFEVNRDTRKKKK